MKKNKQIIEKFKNYILYEIAQYEVSEEIKRQLEYVLISDGKYFRPMLFLLFLDENEQNYENYFDIALAIEMIHTYSLIHDDLPAIDNDEYRRGKLSCHKMYGEDIAILIGDMLLTNAFEQVLKNKFIDCSKKVNIIQYIVDSAGINGMIYGQYMDIKNLATEVELLDKVHILKTSKMIELPLLIGCDISNSGRREEILNIAKEIGLLYQIQDDYLDQYGENIGKTLKKDLISNKKTYSYYYTKEELEEIIYDKKLSILNKKQVFKEDGCLIKLINKILEREK